MASRWLSQAWTSRCPGGPCVSGFCMGTYSTGTAAMGPTWARSRQSWRSRGTCRKRSTVQGTQMMNQQEGCQHWGWMMDGEKTFMSVPPWGLCFKAPNGYVPLAGFRSDRAEMAFSPLAGGLQPSHLDSGSFLKLLYLKKHNAEVGVTRTILRSELIFSELWRLREHLIYWTSLSESSSPRLWQPPGLFWRSEPEDYGPGWTTSHTSQPARCSHFH